jgi:integrase
MEALLLSRAACGGHRCTWSGAGGTFSTSGSRTPAAPEPAKEGTEEDRLLIEDWNRNGGSWHRRRSRASPNSRPLVALLVHTGLRRGEALALQ